jgi:hypothetical protein
VKIEWRSPLPKCGGHCVPHHFGPEAGTESASLTNRLIPPILEELEEVRIKLSSGSPRVEPEERSVTAVAS